MDTILAKWDTKWDTILPGSDTISTRWDIKWDTILPGWDTKWDTNLPKWDKGTPMDTILMSAGVMVKFGARRGVATRFSGATWPENGVKVA